jgi:MFS family permease
MNSLIKDIGRSYIISSFIPAALFIALAVILFSDFIPKSIYERLYENGLLFSNMWFLYFIFTGWLAFMLYSSVDFITRVFEGEIFPKFLARLLIKRYKRKLKRKTDLEAELGDALETHASIGDKNSPAAKKWAERANQAQYKLSGYIQYLETRMPLNQDNLKPTALGNILFASEVYPYERYNLNGILFWPRLYKLFPEQFRYEEEEKNNQLVFLLNSSFLSILLSLLLFGTGIIGVIGPLFPNTPVDLTQLRQLFTRGFSEINPVNYFFFGILFSVISMILYRFSLNTAEDYGFIIRSGFDLYRFELLKQLNLPMPENLSDECSLWENLSQFLIKGSNPDDDSYHLPSYQYRKELLDTISIKDIKKTKSWWDRIFAA